MARNKPEYRVTKHDGQTGKKSTVGRYTTGDAALNARLAERGKLPLGSSDFFSVHQINHER